MKRRHYAKNGDKGWDAGSRNNEIERTYGVDKEAGRVVKVLFNAEYTRPPRRRGVRRGKTEGERFFVLNPCNPMFFIIKTSDREAVKEFHFYWKILLQHFLT